MSFRKNKTEAGKNEFQWKKHVIRDLRIFLNFILKISSINDFYGLGKLTFRDTDLTSLGSNFLL